MNKHCAKVEHVDGFYPSKHVGNHFSPENNQDRIEIVFKIFCTQNSLRYVMYKKMKQRSPMFQHLLNHRNVIYLCMESTKCMQPMTEVWRLSFWHFVAFALKMSYSYYTTTIMVSMGVTNIMYKMFSSQRHSLVTCNSRTHYKSLVVI